MANYIITRELIQKYQAAVQATSEDNALELAVDSDLEWELVYENDELDTEEQN